MKNELKNVIHLLRIKNNTYNLFGKKPLAFEKSFMKNLDKAGLVIINKSDIPNDKDRV